MRAWNVLNVQRGFVARRMTNAIGADFVHGFVRLSKLWATSWANQLNSSLGTDMWAKGGEFLGIPSSIVVL